MHTRKYKHFNALLFHLSHYYLITKVPLFEAAALRKLVNNLRVIVKMTLSLSFAIHYCLMNSRVSLFVKVIIIII